jgi:predicted CXXCH cytochrome family protein
MGASLAVFGSPNISRAQEISAADTACVSCHEKIFNRLPDHVHKPFDERKCYQCHQSQFQFKADQDHSFTFQELGFDRTFSFRLVGFTLGNPSHMSSAYSFSPKNIDIRGAVVNFSGSNGFDQIELTPNVRDPASAILTWKTSAAEYCMLELSEQSPRNNGHGAGGEVKSFHAENTILTEEIGIKACYQCHPKKTLGVSHPVGVLPSPKVWEKMKTSHLPTGKNGILLCITCHFPHASSEGYLGRKAVSEELCLACHPKEIYNPK